MKNGNRFYLVYAYLVFMFMWFGGVILAYHYSDPSNMESLGIGTACGIVLAAFKDMWHYMWGGNKSEDDSKDNYAQIKRKEDKGG